MRRRGRRASTVALLLLPLSRKAFDTFELFSTARAGLHAVRIEFGWASRCLHDRDSLICSLVRAYPKTLLCPEGRTRMSQARPKDRHGAGAIATSGLLRKSGEEYPFLVDFGRGLSCARRAARNDLALADGGWPITRACPRRSKESVLSQPGGPCEGHRYQCGLIPRSRRDDRFRSTGTCWRGFRPNSNRKHTKRGGFRPPINGPRPGRCLPPNESAMPRRLVDSRGLAPLRGALAARSAPLGPASGNIRPPKLALVSTRLPRRDACWGSRCTGTFIDPARC